MKTVILGLGALATTATFAFANSQPYSGQDARAIASLSEADIADLLEGRGWGFAKSAELNGVPGPAHILELADELDLTDAQRIEIQAIFDTMNAKARVLGAAFVETEAALDAAFEDGSITLELLENLAAEAGRLRSELRTVHLAAHLEAAPVLTRHQIMSYNSARGYTSSHDGDGHGHN